MRPSRRTLIHLAGPISILAAWEAYTRLGGIDPIFLPPISTIGERFLELLWSGQIILHAVASLGRLFAGYFLAASIAIALGLFIGSFRILRDVLDPVIEMIRPVSPISLIPLAILWFGIGPESKIFIIFMASFFPILLNTIAGVQNTDPMMIRAALALGAGRMRILRTVSIPAAAPFVYTGLRISMSIAFVVIIAAEMVAAQNGLGWLILDAQRVFDTATVFVGIGVISGLGFTMDWVMRRGARLAFPWMQDKDGLG
jgi:ABC-type nitrate/sulfonate/bicarbonate transport system permease component